MTGTEIRLENADGTVTITLDGPDTRNALAAAAAAELPTVIHATTQRLAADPALVQILRRTVHNPEAWDRAVEVERARQMWSLSRPRSEQS